MHALSALVGSSFKTSKSLLLSEDTLSPSALKVHAFADRLFKAFTDLFIKWKESREEETKLTGQLIPREKKWPGRDQILFDLFQQMIAARLESTNSLPQKLAEEYYLISAESEKEIIEFKKELDDSFFQVQSALKMEKEEYERYIEMTPEAFQEEFYVTNEREKMRCLALKKIELYKKSCAEDLPKNRERLFKMFACDELSIQQQALAELTEIIEKDPLISSGCDKLVQLHDDILDLLEEKKRKNLHPSLIPGVCKLYALTLELILLYHQSALIVMDELKHRAWDGAEGIQKDFSDDPEMKFWGDYAKECVKNLQTPTTVTDEWIMRLRHVLKATATITLGIITQGSLSSTIESCVEDLQKAVYHLEFKQNWFLPVLTTKKLCHLVLNNPAAFQQLTPIIQSFKHSDSPDLLQGMIVALESTALLTEDKTIQEEVLKLFIQYAHLQDEAISFRLIKALSRIYSAKTKPTFSNTAYLLIRLLAAAKMIIGDAAQAFLETISHDWKSGEPPLEKSRPPHYFERVIKYFLKGFSDKKLAGRGSGQSPLMTLIPSEHPQIQSIMQCLAELSFLRAAEADDYGKTPYHIAGEEGYASLVAQIQGSKLSIDINAQELTYRNTALHAAVLNGHGDTCDALLRAKAEPGIHNKQGDTPLHLAVRLQRVSCVILLIGAGADPRAWNQEGLTPIDMAIHSNDAKILGILIKPRATLSLDYITNIMHATHPDRLLSLQVLLAPVSAIPAYAAAEIARLIVGHPEKKEFIQFHQEKLGKDAVYKKAFETTKPQDENKPLLIKKGKQDAYLGLSPLHAAVRNNEIRAVKPFLTGGADVNLPDSLRQFTPLHLACIAENEPMIDLLLEGGANLYAQNIYGDTPLHLLILSSTKSALLEKLLKKAAKEVPADNFGNNLLHYAVLHNKASFIPIIAKACPAFFWQRNQNQQLPIECVTATGLIDIMPLVRALVTGLTSGEEESLGELAGLFHEKTEGKLPFLHLLAATNNIGLAEKLLKQKPETARQKDRSITQKTALHVAAKNGYTYFINLYKDHLQVVDYFSNTAGHLAVLKDQDEFLREWVEAGGDIGAKNSDGHTVVHLAALKGNVALLTFFSEKKAPFDQADAHGSLPVHLAAFEGYVEAVDYLLSQYPKGIEQVDEDGMIPLHHVCLCSTHLPIAELQSTPSLQPVYTPKSRHQNRLTLFKKKVGPLSSRSSTHQRSAQEMHPLMIAAANGHSDTARYEPTRGTHFHVSSGPSMSQSVVSHAPPSPSSPPVKNPKKVLTLLISKRADLEIQDHSGMTPLMLAAANGQISLITILLDHGVDISKRDYDQRTALHHATLGGQADAIPILLSHDDSLARPGEQAIATVQDIHLEPPLHLIAKNTHGYKKDKEKLLKISHILGKAGLGLADENGKTEVHWAAANGLTALVQKFLLLTQESPKLRQAQIAPDRQGRTPLHHAAMSNGVEVVRVLLEFGLNPNLRDESGKIPFLYMAKSGLSPAARMLLPSSNIRIRDNQKNSIVHLILEKEEITASDIDMLMAIFTRAPELATSSNRAGVCPIHIAARQGHTQIIPLLAKYMGPTQEVQIRELWRLDGEGRNAGMIASSTGHKDFADSWRTIKKSDLNAPEKKKRFHSKVIPMIN